MKKRMMFYACTLTATFFAGQVLAQLQIPGTTGNSNYLLPANPTSADNLKLSMGRSCSDFYRYKGNAYQVSMSQNSITVTRGEVPASANPVCPISARDEIDLGRLPAGNYTLTIVNNPNSPPLTPSYSGDTFSNVPFTITDARLLKVAPFVRLDYSGHWWDPNDSGWGLFIWHDARDNVLAAWFTYGADGKPIWYVFQPTWQTFAATTTTPMRQTSRPPGTTIPPPNPTTYTSVGTASLDFTVLGNAALASALGDAGTFTYTFTGGPTTVRNIQRFKP